ncbi:MAG: precorrin-3B C(17)-methyltransferase [Hyphomicrobiales bacterium]|nr:precorrin-3B C(17)-methyltransferase [Hyphomicrobiales bacterium]MDE2114715.1 precorrin-3B C(17)-methyltransferase [Hyphomicrobiales bacterium]
MSGQSTKRGTLAIVGIGPGPQAWITPQASDALAHASDIIGYGPYLARLQPNPLQVLHASDNRVEMDRASLALHLAGQGRHVALVSGGDPGIFAMAGALFEALAQSPHLQENIDISVLPGISAMLAAAARLGAPLGHDFCVLSLSDNLKPWALIERRLTAAAEGDFAIVLYNPASKARPQSIFDAFALMRKIKSPATPVAFAKAIGRSNESIVRTTLAQADPGCVDMSTLVLIGSSQSRWIGGPNGADWLLTPRSYGAVT